MFDITGQDISLLSDEDLRELIGRLCEADLRHNGLSPLSVTWGGDQNASDGGIDVRVATNDDIPVASAIVRANVGYQVKAEDMPRSEIVAEMQPKGCLRASIRELANLSGAYIIVSSKGSVSDTALRERKSAMNDAVRDLANARDLYLDFYDRNRIATWVRHHPGIVAWTRQRIGRAIPGWRPYGDWAGSNEGAEAIYLFDEALRIQGGALKGQSVSAVEGINRLRGVLRAAKGVVRFVGLSGTGKTRLAQALFDRRIGEGSLPPELAIYTNISDDPTPQPIAVATELVSEGRRQVLVIDNCTPKLHNSLSEICRTSGSKVSLLTIEYDVRDDQPEGTDVFELQPSSDDLIEKLLLRRVPELSQVNAHSIAVFAGGNARVALALANTIERGESVASLRDDQLFERLFRQRHESSSSLLSSAQACSLSYSFQGEDTSNGRDSELSKLAAVAGKDVRSLHADIVELKRRDLVQQRGVWRAVLPHAIANRLAALAVESILPEDLEVLFATAPPRLLRSISRRLGCLHTSDAARRIVCEWLAEGGRLAHVEELDDTGIAMLSNVAPVDPVSVLHSIERAIRRERDHGKQLEGEEFRTLLLSLAFDSELFDRSVALIVELIEFEKPGPYANQVRNSFPHLFHLCLSGTHATVEQRLQVIDGLLRSGSEPRQELGFAALDAMLQASNFSSSHRFDFGGRPRDYGYLPKTHDDVLKWFGATLNLCAVHDARDIQVSARIRTVLAQHLRGLWTDAYMFDEVESICRQFRQRRFWPDGWIAIRSIRRFRQEPPSEDEDARLAALEHSIAPESLIEHVRSQVLRNAHNAYEDVDPADYDAQFARRERDLTELGKVLSTESATLDELMSELVACNTGATLVPFARGLIEAGSDRRGIWDRLIASFTTSDPTIRSPEVLVSYLFNLQSVDPDLVETLLQETLGDPRLTEWFPILQTRVAISRDGISRLKGLLALGKIPANRFRGLAYSGRGGVDDRAICELIPMILRLEGGFSVAVEIVWMRLPHGREKEKLPSPELLAAGTLIADAFDFNQSLHYDAYDLGRVLAACLSSAEGIPTVQRMLERLKAKHSHYGFSSISDNGIVGALVAAQPIVVLDALFAAKEGSEKIAVRGLVGHYEHLASPFDRIPAEVFFSWCDKEPAARYPLAASLVKAFDIERNSNSDRRWNNTALVLLERAPDRIEILKRYIDQLTPMSWSGSRAAAWEANVRLLEKLENHSDANLAAFVRGERQRLETVLNDLRQQELESERRENETFE